MTAMVRWLAAARLIDIIETALPTVTVLPAVLPAQAQWPRECISIGHISGDLDFTGWSGPPTTDAVRYEDDFTIDIVASVSTPGQTTLEARSRSSELIQAVLEAIRLDPGISTPTAVDGLLWLAPGRCVGPSSYPLAERTGAGSDCILTLVGRTHKSGS